MKVTSSRYVLSATAPSQYPAESLPELCLIGRSNVGKSSLINRLLGRKNLAQVSGRPGKTRTINFFLVNESFWLVDLPGYGYAQVSKQERAAFGRMIRTYIQNRESLRLILQLVDIRHPPSRDDIQMWHLLSHSGIPVLLVATKCDKVSRNRRPRHLKEIREALGVGEQVTIIPFSSQTGEGREELWAAAEPYLI